MGLMWASAPLPEGVKVSPEGDEHWTRMLKTRKQDSDWNFPG